MRSPLLKNVVAAVLAYVLASSWAAPGVWIVVKLVAVTAVIVAALIAMRETDATELRNLRASMVAR